MGGRPAAVVLLLFLLGGCASSAVRNENALAAAKINVDLGKVYIARGDYALAMHKLERALAQDSDYAPGHSTIAVLYWRLGEPDKAERHFRTALGLAPKDSLIHNSYGAFLCARGRLREADQQFRIAVGNPLYGTPEEAYTNAGLCALRVPDEAKAEQYFRAALRQQPKSPIALRQMARLTFGRKHYLQARAYLQRYEEVGPQTAASLWLRIRVEKQLGDRGAVASYGLRLRSRFPDAEETRLYLEMERHGPADRN